MSGQESVPNPYEDPRGQETDSPSERIVPFFSAVLQAERCPSLATCSGFIAVYWCPIGAAPNPSGGSLAAVTPSAETTPGGRCDRATSLYPRPVLCKDAAARVPFASSFQARGRGSPRQLDPTIAVCTRGGAEIPSKGRAQGERPLGSWACATQGAKQASARYPSVARERPVRRGAHPLRS